MVWLSFRRLFLSSCFFAAVTANGHHTGRTATAVDARKSVNKTGDPQLTLFCNTTGPCRQCAATNLRDKAENHHCRHFSHVQALDCILDLPAVNHSAEVKKDAWPSLLTRQRLSRVQTLQGCVTGQNPKTVAWFETGIVALLFLALPVVIWRKHVIASSRN